MLMRRTDAMPSEKLDLLGKPVDPRMQSGNIDRFSARRFGVLEHIRREPDALAFSSLQDHFVDPIAD